MTCIPRGPHPPCPVDGCEHDDPDGTLAQQGRALLARRLIGTADPAGCSCTKCTGDPFDDTEAAQALDHLSDREAVLFLLDVIRQDRYTKCGQCGGLVVHFADTVAGQVNYARGECPFHPVE
ncbi:hypothetical protein AYK61_02540 [Rhodococcus sp. SBT000017]|uniref:hypothetical protein n=1 Tax=unclassified Rhodococcus (in: high G+C Gram-positive bacteria) TaxID=192944 RepID=UPI000A915C26|nr:MULTISPECIES: hypothetical protein [unclassified Rhodococcus (in: high G+C Gram-positive bacteria)]RMB75636.1 hypothetical protein AYK61_02540 [Rhodococcus sp. SBT000017]